MINAFTGNNIRAAGDLASRGLEARLGVDRPDPQNRTFAHRSPIRWTADHRGKILRSLYTLLLGNPALGFSDEELKTRFKDWWRMVGGALEHAARLYQQHHKEPIASILLKMFDAADEVDEESVELIEVLNMLASMWPGGNEFSAADVHARIDGAERFAGPHIVTPLRTYFTLGGSRPCSPRNVGRGFSGAKDRPLRWSDDEVLTLKARMVHKQCVYRVTGKKGLFD